MKERPILFSAPMIRAIQDGRKTQTRRIVKPRDGDSPRWNPVVVNGYGGWTDSHGRPWPCPYGQPGDLLWVRETFRLYDSHTECACYDQCECSTFHGKPIYRADGDNECIKWRPAIHMPRWASRITLEVTEVRVQRLQEISEADAMAEGAPPSHPSIDAVSRSYGYPDFPRSWFAQTWDAINGPGAWARNDWVFVISFRRV